MLPLAAEVLVVTAVLLGVSLLVQAGLRQWMPRVVAALLAPVAAMLLGFAYVAVAARLMPPDSDTLHLLILMPPFVLAIVGPIMAGLLLWTFFARARV
ncbi:hypothetical protein ACQW02_05595 [Humitalea sp. 24SJ18S-53]|uniref:hypothetical protein n=1 Tax=Humitalea sp. 24SJ18S-53 TaxID=3422307 RepID=UPI003D66D0D5